MLKEGKWIDCKDSFACDNGTLTYVADMLHRSGFFLQGIGVNTVIFVRADNSGKKDWKNSGKRGTIGLMKNIV